MRCAPEKKKWLRGAGNDGRMKKGTLKWGGLQGAWSGYRAREEVGWKACGKREGIMSVRRGQEPDSSQAGRSVGRGKD
jgi:hypothetical protein